MKIMILLQGRFPTEKAYGVTTTGTIKALLKLGHQVTVYSLDSNYKVFDIQDSNYQLLHYTETKFSRKLKELAFKSVGLTSKIAWRVLWKLLLLHNRKLISLQKVNLYWIRDFEMLSFIPKLSSIIYEVHGNVNRYELFKVKSRSKWDELILAPISKSIQDRLLFNGDDLVIIRAPMGIEPNFKETKQGSLEYLAKLKKVVNGQCKGLKVGYVGKFSPNGYSKGIEDLLDLATLDKAHGKMYNISLTGGSANELKSIFDRLSEYGLSRNDIEISGHISHDQAIKKMKSLDVLVLPIPTSKRYVGFPLKAIESIAVGRIVIAARCKIYQDIFNESFEPFWYEPGDAKSLDFTIKTAISDEYLGTRLAQGIEFSSRFTWEERTKKLLNGLISS